MPNRDQFCTALSMNVDRGKRRRGALCAVAFDIEDTVARQREISRPRIAPHHMVCGPIDRVRREIRAHDHGVLREQHLAHESRIA